MARRATQGALRYRTTIFCGAVVLESVVAEEGTYQRQNAVERRVFANTTDTAPLALEARRKAFFHPVRPFLLLCR
jgi:hypothetical protein